MISIHALRVEGDKVFTYEQLEQLISIHALRVEGDTKRAAILRNFRHFYPRPPCGGRPGNHR